MEFGTYFAHQLPRPWDNGSEQRLFELALDQVELADRLGFDYAWVVEQHFLEEYSHSSAPEVFLAAASQRTRRIRLGHGVVLMPPGYNQPTRIAERIATLDLVSKGRVDFGIGDSKSRMELEGFGIEPAERRAMSLEALEQVALMMSSEPYEGYEGKYFSMPARNVVPKPVQKPHPPLWIACSDDATIHLAAKLGIGALAHTFFDQDEAKRVVDDYYETFKRECVPIGGAVNPCVAMIDPFFCGDDEHEARAIGMEAYGFFTYAARHYYAFGRHRPGRTNLWDNSVRVTQALGGEIPLRGAHAIGTPEQIITHLRELDDAGVDQVILMHHAGRMTGEQSSGSLELFAEQVMPSFQADRLERENRKAAELAPYIEAAFARKAKMTPAPNGQPIPVCDAYGLSRPDVELATLDALPETTRLAIMELQKLKAVALQLEP
ncbi:MAG: Luciferase-like, subgroup [Ilumatobacteraceae bacterium]|nr:Luciferase-like, subgroup [Ilumatobacteraceae bacterium]